MHGGLSRNSYKPVKNIFAVLFLAFTLMARAADVTVTLSNVHPCCGACVEGVTKAAASVPNLTVKTDTKAYTVTLTGPDAATVQKGADAIVAAGYFGESSDDPRSMNAAPITARKTKRCNPSKLRVCIFAAANAIMP